MLHAVDHAPNRVRAVAIPKLFLGDPIMRPPNPTGQHKANGTYRADRHQPMPLHPAKPPRAPSWLAETAKAKWKEAARLLSDVGLLTPLDLDALAAYCSTWATWRKAVETIEREGATFTTAAGLVKRHPAVAIAAQAGRDLLAWAERLGLTPAARQRMRVELTPAESLDPLEALLADAALG